MKRNIADDDTYKYGYHGGNNLKMISTKNYDGKSCRTGTGGEWLRKKWGKTQYLTSQCGGGGRGYSGTT